MELERPAFPSTPLTRLTHWVLVLGALFSLYLVLHPFTPLARLRSPSWIRYSYSGAPTSSSSSWAPTW